MGYDAYSKNVFGKEMDKSELTITTKVRACSHKTDTTQKFCSECGKPVWKEEKEMLVDDGYGKKLGFFRSDYNMEEGILGFELVTTDSSDTRYYEVPKPTPGMVVEILEFFKKNNIECSEKDLKTYLFTRHSY